MVQNNTGRINKFDPESVSDASLVLQSVAACFLCIVCGKLRFGTIYVWQVGPTGMKHKTLFLSVAVILLALTLLQIYLMNFIEHEDLPPYAGWTLYIIAAWIILAIAFTITQRQKPQQN